jgi:hypothetical protein
MLQSVALDGEIFTFETPIIQGCLPYYGIKMIAYALHLFG